MKIAVVDRKIAAARAIGYPRARLAELGEEGSRVCFAMALLQVPGPNGDVFDMHNGVLYSIIWIAAIFWREIKNAGAIAGIQVGGGRGSPPTPPHSLGRGADKSKLCSDPAWRDQITSILILFSPPHSVGRGRGRGRSMEAIRTELVATVIKVKGYSLILGRQVFPSKWIWKK